MNWDQLKTILWLRWRLMNNQWRRGGGLGAVFAAIVVAGALILSAAAFAGGLLGGIFGLREALPTAVMMLRISSLPSTRSSRARSTLRILPRNGKMA